MNLTKKEKDFINFLLNKSISEKEQEIITQYKEIIFILFDLNTIFSVISEKQYQKNKATIDTLKNKFLTIERKKDKHILSLCEPLLKCSKFETVNLNIEIETEEISKKNYIIQLLPDVRNDLKNKILSSEEKEKELNDFLIRSYVH